MNVDKQLISSALELKPQDRFYLIELLVRSLDKPDPEIDEIWLKEAEARLETFREGKTKGIPVEEVIGESI
ncbi:MAG: addiction module protein [Candidatus Marinimicrobia bacterium]|jgi:putative addiction module component (TIGR02574 family)|nr:addiction module protein [Candidatus Neomarinimicrobiota bacterium]